MILSLRLLMFIKIFVMINMIDYNDGEDDHISRLSDDDHNDAVDGCR